MDNVLLAQEIVSDYGRIVGRPKCTLKLDIRKAFSSVYWDFLLNILKFMGFPTTYIAWIHKCNYSPVYSVNFIGKLGGFIPGAKGVRQGDPPLSLPLYPLHGDP